MKKIKLLALALGSLLFSNANATCVASDSTMPGGYYPDVVATAFSSQGIGQSFIATQTGKIAYITVIADSEHGPLTGGLLASDGTNLGTAIYDNTVYINNGTAYVDFYFEVPVQVQQGVAYAFAFQATDFSMVNAYGTLVDTYPLGTAGDYDLFTGMGFPLSGDMYLNACYSELGSGGTPLAPTTKLTSADCGKTIMSTSETISADPVSGAERYRFTFAASGQQTVIKQTADPIYNYPADIDKFAPGVTYSATVAVKTLAGWGPEGQSCNVTTYSTPSTQLISADCDKVMVTRNETLTAEAVSGADRYLFTFTASGQPTIVREQSGTIYNYPFFASNFLPGTQYTVTVQARVNRVWSMPNPACTFTTPGGEEGQIQNCGTTYTSWIQNVNAVQQSGAQKYSFIFNASGQPQVSYTTTKPYVKLSRVNGLVGSTEYSVRLRVLKNDIFGPAGSIGSCLITTPAGSPTREAVFAEGSEEIFMYPNPVDGNRVYFSGQINNVEVIDMLGNVIATEAQAESMDVSELSAGMYMIKSDEGIVRMMVK